MTKQYSVTRYFKGTVVCGSCWAGFYSKEVIAERGYAATRTRLCQRCLTFARVCYGCGRSVRYVDSGLAIRNTALCHECIAAPLLRPTNGRFRNNGAWHGAGSPQALQDLRAFPPHNPHWTQVRVAYLSKPKKTRRKSC